MDGPEGRLFIPLIKDVIVKIICILTS